MRSLIFLFIAALFLGSAGYLAHMMFFNQGAVTARAATEMPLAPKKFALRLTAPREAGDLVGPHLVEWHPLAADEEPTALFLEEATTVAELDGAVMLRPRPAGAYLARTDILRPGEAGYAKALLREGERAQAVRIANRGDYEALRIGDHVDLLVSVTVPANAAKAGETLVRRVAGNVRITALSDLSASRGEGRVTLALPEEAVAQVLLAESIGKLRIAPHGYANDRTVAEPRPEAALSIGDLFPELAPAPALRRATSREIVIMRGSETSVQSVRPARSAGQGGS